MSKKTVIFTVILCILIGTVIYATYSPEGGNIAAIRTGDLSKFSGIKKQSTGYVPGSGYNPNITKEVANKVAKYKTPRVSQILKEVKEKNRLKDVMFNAVVYSVYKKKRSFQIMDIKTAIEASSCCVACILDAPKLIVKLMDDNTELPKKLAQIKVKGKVLKQDEGKGTYIMENSDGYTFVRQRTWGDLQ
jgi:hypothetical protein